MNNEEQNFEKNDNTSNAAGEKRMEAAYKLASQLVKDRLQLEDGENIEILDELQADDILVIEGQYDHIHVVLEHSGMPFKRTSVLEV